MIPTPLALDTVLAFILVAFRISGLFLAAPLFSSRDIPRPVKLGLSLLVAITVFPMVPVDAKALPSGIPGMAGLAAAELAVGITVGFAATLLFSAFQLAGQHIGQGMGLSMADIVDPLTEAEVSVVGQLQFFIALGVYVAVGAHRWLLAAVASSFETVPLGGFRPSERLVGMLLDAFGNILPLSFQIAAPVLVALFLSTVALGFVARAVPQMNVLMLSFPLQIGLGLGVLIWTVPAMAWMAASLCEGMARDVGALIAVMGPGR